MPFLATFEAHDFGDGATNVIAISHSHSSIISASGVSLRLAVYETRDDAIECVFGVRECVK
jgi:hypothetical protein